MTDTSWRYKGNDNYGNPKSDYLKKISELDEDKLFKECKDLIWLSAYANNNPRSDYHWQVDACYDECVKRNKSDLYTKAHQEVSAGI